MTVAIGPGAVAWLCLLTVTSWSAFFLFRPLFPTWPDQGFGLAKVWGPLIVALVAWLLANWLGIQWGSAASGLGGLVLAATAAVVAFRTRALAAPWRRVCAIEGVWLVAMLAFAAYRSLDASLFGAERFMDHALFASIARSEALPPGDPWLAGYPVNYHYVGHACWAALASLVPLPTTVLYNFVLATLPAQFVVALCSVGGALAPRFWWVGAFTGMCAGPLTTLGLLVGRPGSLPSTSASTRIIPGTINEYPFFSFTNGELHAHVIALPVFVVFAAWVHRIATMANDDVAGPSRCVRHLALVFVVTLCAAVLVLISSWEVPSAAMGLGIAAIHCRRAGWRAWVVGMAGLAVAGVVAWPFVASVSVPRLPAGLSVGGSPLGRFLLVMGLWLVPVLLWVARDRRRAWWGLVVLVLAATAWWLPNWAVRVALALVVAGLWRRRAGVAPVAWWFACWALALLFLAESVWVDDVYGQAFGRINVVFKWHLQAMVLLALSAPAFLAAMVPVGSPRRWPVRHLAIVGVLVVVALMQPAANLAARVRAPRQAAPTLDSLDQVRRRYPGDAAVVEYLVANANPDAVVLEAAGTQYSYASRISSLSGQPTLIGWAVHEGLWRRGLAWDDILRARGALVESLYAGPADGLEARMRAAGVAYIVIGVVERRRYSGISEDRFGAFADVVARAGDTVLLRVR